MTSKLLTFLLKKNGSNKAVKKEEVAKQTTATEMVEILTAWKKKYQCNMITQPVARYERPLFSGTLMVVLAIVKKANSETTAMSILNITMTSASRGISPAKIPVNPQMKTTKWRINGYDFSLSITIIKNSQR